MKKELLILSILLLLSCDSETFDVHEYDPNTFDYYDHVAHGWDAIFQEKFDLAFNYFQQAIDSEDVEYKNSAYVGKAWTLTFNANEEFNASEDDNVDETRLTAQEWYDLAIVDSSLARVEYELCESVNCFEKFKEDLDVGLIYLDVLRFYMENPDALSLSDLLSKLELYLLNNSDYDVASNKPTTYQTTFNFDYKNLTILLSQFLMREGDDCAAAYYLSKFYVCNEPLDNRYMYNFSHPANQLISEDHDTLLGLTFPTGNHRHVIDFTFLDVNDQVIDVTYLGEDQLGEGLPASSLDPYSISYENGNGLDYILYNIPDDIKSFQIQFEAGLQHVSPFTGDIFDSGFDFIDGCYDANVFEDPTDDECIQIGNCIDIDESHVIECINDYGFPY